MNTLLNREEAMWPFRQRFDKLFDQFFGPDGLHSVRSMSRTGYPKLDAYVANGEFRIEASVPGVKHEDLKVEIVPQKETYNGIDVVGGKVLKITGQMDYCYQNSPDTVFQIKELRRSHFERQVLLPDTIEGDPEAVLDNGILRLVWKLPEEKKEEVKLIPVLKVDAQKA